MSTKSSCRTFLKPAEIAFSLFGVGALPIAAIEFGFYQRGTCDPAAWLALVWLGMLSLFGTGFAMWSIYRAESQGARIALPVVAVLVNVSGFLLPLWLLVR